MSESVSQLVSKVFQGMSEGVSEGGSEGGSGRVSEGVSELGGRVSERRRGLGNGIGVQSDCKHQLALDEHGYIVEHVTRRSYKNAREMGQTHVEVVVPVPSTTTASYFCSAANPARASSRS